MKGQSKSRTPCKVMWCVITIIISLLAHRRHTCRRKVSSWKYPIPGLSKTSEQTNQFYTKGATIKYEGGGLDFFFRIIYLFHEVTELNFLFLLLLAIFYLFHPHKLSPHFFCGEKLIIFNKTTLFISLFSHLKLFISTKIQAPSRRPNPSLQVSRISILSYNGVGPSC